ncbi:MAG: hypothetical protein L0I76_09000 [Pseudonocardia sp.]|nr:hypothetical protein [Pseudonocardia sp.]
MTRTGSDPSSADAPPASDPPHVLVVGFDPSAVPGVDPDVVTEALNRGQDRFADHGIVADLCLLPLDDTIEEVVVERLRRRTYDCVVIGGGIRKPEPLLELFESIVNLVRRHALDAQIAFNSSPEDSADAALRRLRRTT